MRAHIREFRAASGVERVVVLWTANTERYSEVCPTTVGQVAPSQACSSTLHALGRCAVQHAVRPGAWQLPSMPADHQERLACCPHMQQGCGW